MVWHTWLLSEQGNMHLSNRKVACVRYFRSDLSFKRAQNFSKVFKCTPVRPLSLLSPHPHQS